MEGSPIPVLTVPTVPYEDQRPAGGGGLRRPTGLFEGQRNYLPNFIQSVLSSIDLRDRQGCTMVVGSDGRYFSRTATEIVVQMAAANGVSDPPRPSLASRRAAAPCPPPPARRPPHPRPPPRVLSSSGPQPPRVRDAPRCQRPPPPRPSGFRLRGPRRVALTSPGLGPRPAPARGPVGPSPPQPFTTICSDPRPLPFQPALLP